MTHIPHELHEEFPEYLEKLNELKVSNAHFVKLSDEYHEINRAIYRAEAEIEPTDDFHLEDMRKLRLKLKDEIFGMLSDKA